MANKLLIATSKHYIDLPKGSKSPTGSIYKRFDIKSQTRALWSGKGNRVTSAEPFEVTVKLSSGKVKAIKSKPRTTKHE